MSLSSRRILVVDSNADSGEALKQQIASWGYEVILEGSSPSIDSILKTDPAVIIDSSTLISGDGFDVLRHVKTYQTGIPVILLAERGSIELAVRAIQDEGAYHYFEKPVDANKLRVVLDRAVELNEAKRENERLRRQLQERGTFGELIGNSAPMREIYSLIEQVAPSSASVLITGESGTGKELVARTIHQLSPRRDKPFIGINCSAIPETLMESELFGHEKGAFTGAASRRQGCFELADGGTLLLDEIAEMPELLQAKLLRVIEERSLRRLGSRKEVGIDVRLLAATNKNPEEAVAKGRLREDLLYRLNVFRLQLPALKDRKDDLPLLAQYLVEKLAERHGRPARFLSPAALTALQFHAWPGNVRELRNVIERAVIICSGDQIERHHFAPYPIDQRERHRNEDTITLPVGTPLEEVERQMLMRTLQKTKNNKTRAAELLGISLKTLHNKLNLYRERGQLDEE
ncbi:MAG: sigma-54-dependent Fis family transcriptional regulator [Pyrinomonadaceae bacterium]|nr:sigma-54-dependent Fis family transcriptional regulator [Pyrinomonadaceae bacterium]